LHETEIGWLTSAETFPRTNTRAGVVRVNTVLPRTRGVVPAVDHALLRVRASVHK
jgi:hypothetical protein